jgi:hypothetical protein
MPSNRRKTTPMSNADAKAIIGCLEGMEVTIKRWCEELKAHLATLEANHDHPSGQESPYESQQ